MELSRKKQTARRNRKERSPLWKQVGIGLAIVLLLGLLGTGIWYGTRIQSLTIESVAVMGGPTISTNEVQAMAEQTLVGSYYRLVPKRFVWTYPEKTIIDRISRIPRIKEVRITRDGQALSIFFTEYTPHALWCQDTTCFFLDQYGYAFAKAPELFGSALVRYKHFEIEPELGLTPFDQTVIERTEQFIDAAKRELALNIISVEQSAPMELTYHLSGGGTIYTSLDQSATETFENLLTIFRSGEFEHLEPGNFRYVDLRFGNKVFVNEELDVSGVASSTASTTQE